MLFGIVVGFTIPSLLELRIDIAMALPHFRSLAARRQKKEQEATGDRVISGERNNEDTSERTLTPTQNAGVDIKLATKTRKIFIILSSFLFLISTVFLILVSFQSTSHL